MDELAQQVADRLKAARFVEVEASGRHVHLTEADAQTLFGHPLTPTRPLSQPGQFACAEMCIRDSWKPRHRPLRQYHLLPRHRLPHQEPAGDLTNRCGGL